MNATQVKRGRPKGKKLTKTDLLLMRRIGEEGFLSYSELRKNILSHYSRQHSWVIPKRLVQMGYLNQSLSDQGSILGWSLTPQALQLIDPHSMQRESLIVKPPTYRTAYQHDVTLREIKEILIQSPNIHHWIPEYILKAHAKQSLYSLNDQEKRNHLLKVPDGIFQFKSAGEMLKGALELELTRKSKCRIYQRFEAHILNPEIDFIFFVVGDQPLLEILWNVYQAVLDQSPMIQGNSRRNGVYFALLSSIREHQLKAPFIGLDDTYCFA
jgi:hypothetical protein